MATTGWLHADALKPWDKNPRKNDPAVPGVAASIRRFGFVAPIVVWRGGNRMVAGHTRLKAMRSLLEEDPDFVAPGAPGPGMVRVIFHEFDNEVLADAYAIADNKLGEAAEWDTTLLFASLRRVHDEDDKLLKDIGFTEAESVSFLSGIGEAASEDVNGTAPDAVVEKAKRSLAERFGVPPFSILDARQGYWQDRKRAWLALGIKSEIGRGENLLGRSLQETVSLCVPKYADAIAFIDERRARGMTDEQIRQEALACRGKGGRGNNSLSGGLTWGVAPAAYDKDGNPITAPMSETDQARAGTSLFDPVLTEVLVRWFSPLGGNVLDPFAGGSVRGLVTCALGRLYTGVDLRPEQVEANREQVVELSKLGPFSESSAPRWLVGDAGEVVESLPESYAADFVFTCPPYADLEVYSDDPRDLSTMEYDAFLTAYRKIIADACARLKSDRFAAIVVGDVRDARGSYRNFVSDTIAAFMDAGTTLYNEAILVTAASSLPLRAGRQFQASRKLGKTHQNVLVFVKGDPRKAVAAIGDSEFGEDEPAPGAELSPGVEPLTLGGEV